MNIKDKKIIDELKIIMGYLKDIDSDKLDYHSHINIVKCETSLALLLNLIDDNENLQ